MKEQQLTEFAKYLAALPGVVKINLTSYLSFEYKKGYWEIYPVANKDMNLGHDFVLRRDGNTMLGFTELSSIENFFKP